MIPGHSAATALQEMQARLPLRLWLWTAVGTVGVLAAMAVVVSGAAMPLIQPDTASYLAWSSERTPGYPLFLQLVGAVSPDYAMVPLVQYGLFIAAMIALCDAFAGLMRSFWAGIVLALAIFGNLALMRHATAAMPDSLFVALLLAHAGFLLHAVRNPRPRWLTLSGLMLGMAVLMRPLGYAFLFALPWMAVLWPDLRLRRSAIVAVAALAPVFLASLVNQLERGYFGIQTMGQQNALISMAVLLPPVLPGIKPALTQRAYNELSPVRQAAFLPQGWDRQSLAWNLAAAFGSPAAQVAAETADTDVEQWKTSSPYWRDLAIDQLCAKMVRETIAADPRGFAEKVVRAFYADWFVTVATTAADFAAASDAFGEFGQQHADQLRSAVKIVPAWVFALKFLVCGTVALISFSSIAAGLIWPLPQLRTLAYLSVCLNLYFLLIAGTGSAVPRYLLAAWPLQCMLVIGAAHLPGACLRRWRSRSAALAHLH